MMDGRFWREHWTGRSNCGRHQLSSLIKVQTPGRHQTRVAGNSCGSHDCQTERSAALHESSAAATPTSPYGSRATARLPFCWEALVVSRHMARGGGEDADPGLKQMKLGGTGAEGCGTEDDDGGASFRGGVGAAG